MVRVGKPIDRTPSGKHLPGGISIVQLDTHSFKDIVHSRMDKAVKQQIRAAYLHAGSEEYWREYASHLSAEEKQKDARGREEWVKVRKDNHLLDCEVYAHACAAPEWLGGIMALRGRKARYRGADTGPVKPAKPAAKDIVSEALKNRRAGRPVKSGGRNLW